MSPAIVMITSMHQANVGISLSSLVFCASILLSTRVQVFREIYVGKSRWGFTVSAGAVEISKMRRHSPSPSFASRVPIPTFFRHWSRQQGGFSKGEHGGGESSWLRAFSFIAFAPSASHSALETDAKTHWKSCFKDVVPSGSLARPYFTSRNLE